MFAFFAALLLAQPAAVPAPAFDRQLPADTAGAADIIRAQLPLRQGEATIVGVTAFGPELIIDLDPDATVDLPFIARFRAALPNQLCGNPEARRFIERGGVFTYRLRTVAAEIVTTSIDRTLVRCAPVR